MVWTDAIQMVIFCAPLVIIAGLGTHAVGGWNVVWEEAAKGKRLEFFKYVHRVLSISLHFTFQKSNGNY